MFQQDINLGPGTGSFATHTFEIFVMLFVAFLMGLWMGWALWSRFRQIAEKMRIENESLTLTVNSLRAELDGLRTKVTAFDTERVEQTAQLEILDRENAELRSRLINLEDGASRVHDRNRRLETELGLSYDPEQEFGADIPLEINTPETTAPEEDSELWPLDPEAELAGMNVEDATATPELVEEFGDSHPAFILQDEPITLDQPADDTPEELPLVVFAAPETVAPTVEEEPAPVAEPPVVIVMPPGHREDLKIVEGIGPKIEELMFQNGILTYQQLAETPVEEIRNILSAAGSRFAMHDPGTWSAQALLAANGEWDNLKAYQDFLNAGKRP